MIRRSKQSSLQEPKTDCAEVVLRYHFCIASETFSLAGRVAFDTEIADCLGTSQWPIHRKARGGDARDLAHAFEYSPIQRLALFRRVTESA